MNSTVGFTDLVITEFISTYKKLDINWEKKKKKKITSISLNIKVLIFILFYFRKCSLLWPLTRKTNEP